MREGLVTTIVHILFAGFAFALALALAPALDFAKLLRHRIRVAEW